MATKQNRAPAKQDYFEWAHRHRHEIVWMSQNTNTIPLTPKIKDAIITSVAEAEYNLYPYKPGIFGLREAILEDLELKGQEVLITNGGLEALYIIARGLLKPGEEVITTDPSFLPFHHQASLSHTVVKEVDIYRKPYKLTPGMVEETVGPKTRMLFLEDPHNPLGSGYTHREKEALLDVAQEHNLYVVDDITYRDFDPDHFLAAEAYPEGTVTAYSFSKGCGLAGMRIGALVAPPELMRVLKPFDTNVLGANVLAQRAALAALECKDDWIHHVREVCKVNQGIIRRTVEKVKGTFLPVFPAKANNFCIDVSGRGVDPEALEGELLTQHLIHVRAGSYLSPKHGGEFIRLSFTVPTEQCLQFEEAFPAAVGALAQR